MSDPTRTDPDEGSIVVSGTGRVAVAPDIADLRLGVSVTRPTVDTARAEAATTMEAILAAMDAAGIPRSDVRTTLLSVQPRYDYRDGKPPTLTGYELANAVEDVADGFQCRLLPVQALARSADVFLVLVDCI